MRRRHLSRLARTRIYDSTGGFCCICGFLILAGRAEKWIIEHKKPLWLGGADEEWNMGPAHQHCAVAKTAAEAPVKAKSDRQRANHLGIKKRSAFACSRDSKWKKKVSGEVVRR